MSCLVQTNSLKSQKYSICYSKKKRGTYSHLEPERKLKLGWFLKNRRKHKENVVSRGSQPSPGSVTRGQIVSPWKGSTTSLLGPLFSLEQHNVGIWHYITPIAAAAAAATHRSVWKLFENRKLQANGQSFRRNWAGEKDGASVKL